MYYPTTNVFFLSVECSYIMARHRASYEHPDDEEVNEIIGNGSLSDHYLALARDLDVMEAKVTRPNRSSCAIRCPLFQGPQRPRVPAQDARNVLSPKLYGCRQLRAAALLWAIGDEPQLRSCLNLAHASDMATLTQLCLPHGLEPHQASWS